MVKTKDGKYILDEEEVRCFMSASVELQVFRAFGGDNWSEYGDHYEEYFQEDRERTGNEDYGTEKAVEEWLESIEVVE